jgi:hypothetical protein
MEKKSRHIFIKIGISLLISCLLLFFFFQKISFQEAWTALRATSWVLILAVFALYIVTTYYKGLRWREILQNKLSRKDSFTSLSVNSMFNNLLPFKLGELSMLYLLRRKGIKYRLSLAFLIILRLMDFAALLLLFIVGLLWMGKIPGITSTLIVIIIAFFILVLVLLIFAVFFHEKALAILLWLVKCCNLDKKRLIKKALKKARLVVKEMQYLKQGGLLFRLALLSLMTWILGIVSVYILMVGMGVAFPFQAMFLAIALQVILSNLPIQGLAGFGTYEGFWVVSFVLLGMDTKTAIITGLNTHLVLLLMTVILGLASLFFLGRSDRKIY